MVLLLGLNHMAGGNPANVLRPTGGLVTRLVSMAVGLVNRILGTAFKLGAQSMKNLPKDKDDPSNSERGPGPPPPRW